MSRWADGELLYSDAVIAHFKRGYSIATGDWTQGCQDIKAWADRKPRELSGDGEPIP